MPDFSEKDVHKGMHVYSSDDHDVGHVADVYPDSFLVHKGLFFPTDRYIPYDAIATVENDRVILTMRADEVKLREWTKRPDIEADQDAPTQLMYDRGHGAGSDPFEQQNPDKP